MLNCARVAKIIIVACDFRPMQAPDAVPDDADARVQNYKTIARRKVPEMLHPHLPTSFDIIGDIAVVKIDDEIWEYRKDIGSSILGAYKSIMTVAADAGVSGDFRQRVIEVIAGKPETLTVHREYGLRLEVDISMAYFSPRLATERWRVTQEVQPRERIVDAFAGVGPFSIMIAKHRKPVKIHAIDINPAAFQYLVRNIALNKVGDIVAPLCGDSMVELGKIKGDGQAIDRIIMNLPWRSFEFFIPAIECVASGGVIHYYGIDERDEIDKRVSELRSAASKKDIGLRVLHQRTIKSYSPSQVNYVLDIGVEK
jgi:tRNA (guanine37-N1)-methyltransferase